MRLFALPESRRATLGRTCVNDMQDEFLRYGALELHAALKTPHDLFHSGYDRFRMR